MQKYVLAALLATATLGAKVPLTKRPVSLTSYSYLKEKLDTPTASNSNSLGSSQLPLKDYMNTQYFADIEIGTPA
jgi:hypothetical protein